MTFTIHASKNGQSVTTVRIIPAVLSTRRACWKAWAGRFTSPIRLATSSTLRTSIGFHRLLTRGFKVRFNRIASWYYFFN